MPVLRPSRPRGQLHCLLLVFILLRSSLAAAAVPIPDAERDRAFLFGQWQPGRASVVLFIDPLCPYCKRVIPKLELISDYNLFVYWVPIFGQRSERAIAPFFHCQRPTSPALLGTVNASPAQAKALLADCGPQANVALRQRNDAMAAAYPINGVPAFFLQGRRESLSGILTRQRTTANKVNGVVLEWQRYGESQLLPVSGARSLAVIAGAGGDPQAMSGLLREYQPAHFFAADGWGSLCGERGSNDAGALAACDDAPQLQSLRRAHYLELVALLGLDPVAQRVIVVSRDGRLITLDK